MICRICCRIFLSGCPRSTWGTLAKCCTNCGCICVVPVKGCPLGASPKELCTIWVTAIFLGCLLAVLVSVLSGLLASQVYYLCCVRSGLLASRVYYRCCVLSGLLASQVSLGLGLYPRLDLINIDEF